MNAAFMKLRGVERSADMLVTPKYQMPLEPGWCWPARRS
jgi:hypothetical protein